MPFVSRARSYYASKDVVKAVITLIEGLKRYPERTDAFRWLLDLYCEEITNTGLEEDLVNVVDTCPDPEGVYAWIFQRLQRGGRHRFIKRLDRARREVALSRGILWEEWTVIVQRVTDAQRAERHVEALVFEEEPVPVVAAAAAWSGAPQAYHNAPQAYAPQAYAPQPVPTALHPAPPVHLPAAPAVSGAASAAWGSPAWANTLPPVALMPGPVRGAPHEPAEPWPSHSFEPALHSFEPAPHSFEPAPHAFEPAPPHTPRRPAPLDEPPAAAANPDAHPFLLQRQSQRQRRTDELDTPSAALWRADNRATVEALRPRPVEPAEVPDMDALLALEEQHSASRGSEVAWRPEPAAQARGGQGKRLLVWLLILLALAGAALAIILYRSDVIAEKRSAVETSDANAERFVLAEIVLAEAQLAEALRRDPGSAGVAARLRWTRALRAHLQRSDVTPPSTADPATPEPRIAAWYLAAQTLDALQAGQGDLATQRLTQLRAAEPDCTDFPQGLAAWLEGEFHLRAAEPARAALAFERAASYGFAPGAVALADLRFRQGDAPLLRAALDQLAALSPEHPVIALGEAVYPRLNAALTGQPLPAPGVNPATLQAVADDRRFEVWTALATDAGGFAAIQDPAPHPTLQLLAAREQLQARRVDDAAATLDRFDATRAAAPLQQAAQRLSTEGFRDAGRPDMALRFLPAAPTHEVELRDWVNARAEDALLRAAILADLGQLDGARELLALLLRDPIRAPTARVLALQLHLHEGRVEDVRRHAERLKDHRGALVASAAIDLYQGRDASALAILGSAPHTPGPDPQIDRFEQRTRLLALHGAGRQSELRDLLRAPLLPISTALAARVHPDPDKARALAELAAEGDPTALDDRIDLAVYALEHDQFENAELWASRILEASPESTEGHRVTAVLLLRTRRAAQAIPHARAATRGRPDLASLHLVAPEVELKQGSPLKAAVELQSWLDAHPTDLRAIHMLGQAWLDARHLARGSKDLERRLTLVDDRNDRDAAGALHLWLGRLYRSSLGEAKGGHHLRRARELLGDDPRVLVALAEYHRHRDPTHALELYRAALQAPEPPPEAFLAFGRFAAHRGMKREAIDALERYLPLAQDRDSRTWASERLAELR